MDKDVINKILEAAVRAPSGDNVQPWRFGISNDYTQINLFNLPDKDNSYYNYQQTASYIAHGAVLENIAIASRHFGCNADITLFPDEEQPNQVARINLTTASPHSEPLYDFIDRRYTNRFLYQPRDVSPEDINSLTNADAQIPGCRIHIVSEKKQIRKLAKILMVNDRLVFENQAIHQFLFDKIRWNKAQIEATKDGMPVDCLGLSAMEKAIFPMLRYWWFVKLSNFLGLSQVIALKCWLNCCRASLLGMISISGHEKRDFVEGGRAMQRVWLEASRQGLAFQPIIGLSLLIHRLDQQALHDLSGKHQQVVADAKQSLSDFFELPPSETLMMGFRMGQSKSLPVKTERRPFL